MKIDLYGRVTAQIVASLEQGVKPWLKPWSVAAASADAHPSVAGERAALSGDQCPDAVGRGGGSWLCLPRSG